MQLSDGQLLDIMDALFWFQENVREKDFVDVFGKSLGEHLYRRFKKDAPYKDNIIKTFNTMDLEVRRTFVRLFANWTNNRKRKEEKIRRELEEREKGGSSEAN
jgi:hypothetical protein